MRIQRQMVGKQIDIVSQQQSQTLFQPTSDSTVMTAPEQSVVNQQSVCALFNRCLYESQARGDTGDDFFHLAAAFHLQTVGAVIFKQLRLQQVVAH